MIRDNASKKTKNSEKCIILKIVPSIGQSSLQSCEFFPFSFESKTPKRQWWRNKCCVYKMCILNCKQFSTLYSGTYQPMLLDMLFITGNCINKLSRFTKKSTKDIVTLIKELNYPLCMANYHNWY